ncbi:MAG: hypothetical protein ACRDYY_17045 [Acidimicrobiales bacterium]
MAGSNTGRTLSVAPARPTDVDVVRDGVDALGRHGRAVPAPYVGELRQLLGVRLVAYIAGVSETRAVHQWASGSREIRDHEVADRVRLVYQVTQLLVSRDSDKVAQAWFQGLNPKLDDHSPARLLREGKLAAVGPQVLAAARAFAALG